MSPDDEASLEVSKKMFKMEQKRFCVAVYIFKTLMQGEVKDWLIINSALLFHKKMLAAIDGGLEDQLSPLVEDFIGIQVLSMLTSVMKMVVNCETENI